MHSNDPTSQRPRGTLDGVIVEASICCYILFVSFLLFPRCMKNAAAWKQSIQQLFNLVTLKREEIASSLDLRREYRERYTRAVLARVPTAPAPAPAAAAAGAGSAAAEAGTSAAAGGGGANKVAKYRPIRCAIASGCSCAALAILASRRAVSLSRRNAACAAAADPGRRVNAPTR